MIKMPVYHTTTMPSMKLNRILSELKTIAALAKAANEMQVYIDVRSLHDNLVNQYNLQNRPKKKGFWEQFKDNLTFRDMDTHVVMTLDTLEKDSSVEGLSSALKSTWSQNKIQSELRTAIQQFNMKY